MRVQQQAIYHCINPDCGRAMPRPVNFCPWCGTAQTAAARALADGRTAHADAEAQRMARAAAGAGVAASLAGGMDVPEAPYATLEPAAPKPVPPPPPPPPPPPTAKPAVPPSATAFGHGGAAARPGVSGGPAKPRQREPIRLRWWILTLAILWGVWLVAKPSARKTERRIDAAIAIARDCKAKEAQDELIALRRDRATPAQLERLQKALNDEAAKCTRRRQRDKALTEAQDAVDSALKAGNAERARLRLQAFVKRWGADDETRALDDRIDEARRAHPLAVPRAADP